MVVSNCLLDIYNARQNNFYEIQLVHFLRGVLIKRYAAYLLSTVLQDRIENVAYLQLAHSREELEPQLGQIETELCHSTILNDP